MSDIAKHTGGLVRGERFDRLSEVAPRIGGAPTALQDCDFGFELVDATPGPRVDLPKPFFGIFLKKIYLVKPVRVFCFKNLWKAKKPLFLRFVMAKRLCIYRQHVIINARLMAVRVRIQAVWVHIVPEKF